MTMKYGVIGVLTLFGIAVVSGCSPETVKSATHDAQQDTTIAIREAKRVERQARPVLREVGKRVGPDLKKLDLGARATAALKLNRNLPPTIRVDASETGIRLRGTVHTLTEKRLAERVVRDTLPPGAHLSNELEIRR